MNLLTLAEAREELWKFGNFSSSYVESTAEEKAAWDRRLNRVVQRFFETMKPARTFRRIDITIYDDTITLPRECEGLFGCVPLTTEGYRCNPLFIFSRFHEFAESGNYTCGKPVAQPLTENAQTFRDPEASFYLRAKGISGSGQNYTFIGGTDADDDEYFDSVELQITNGTTTTTRVWNTLPRIHKEETDEPVELYSVDTTTGDETLVAVHAPGETSPAYQRYSVPDWGDTVTQARCLTRLCYVKLIADKDIVIPSSYGAIQLGLQALQYEEVNDWDNAAASWDRAMQIIDSGKESVEGDAEIMSIRSQRGFACDGIPSIM